MNVTKEEFQEWKSSFVTQEVFKVIIDRIEDAKDILSVNAGSDPSVDRYTVGMINAFREVLAITWEE